MNKRFIFTGFLTSLVNLALHGLAYALILKDFYSAHPAGSEEFIKQLHRSPDQLVIWAMVGTSLTMGYFIALIMKWSGARTFITGLKYGAIAGILFWSSVNFGLYASSNMFSFASVFVDLACSATVMTLASAFAAWMLGLNLAK
jgi:hypothetical protein